MIIIITDGRSSPETRRPEPEAERLRAAGVRIVVVGVTNLIDEEELRRLSSAPHRRNRWEEEGVGGGRVGIGTGQRRNWRAEEQVGGGTGGRMNRWEVEQVGGGTGGQRNRWAEKYLG